FDTHVLSIKLRHTDLTRDELIYVADASSVNKKTEIEELGAGSGWAVKDIFSYQDIISNVSSLGDPFLYDFQNKINYSRFNTEIRIQRDDPVFAVKIFFPIIVMILILYAMYFIPPDCLGIRILIFMTVLATNGYFHQKLLTGLQLEYLSALECTFFIVYILVLIAVITSILIYSFYRKGDKKIKVTNYTAIILHP
ncbi:MAG: hypothetical protein GY730_10045, partial [bacterium]|nr:hypothetical protein [bacterium]